MMRRFALGFTVAKAFNTPQKLTEDVRSYREKKRRLAHPEPPESDGTDVINLFRSSGLKVIDGTRH